MKKVWNVVSAVFVWLVVVISVAMMIFTIISVNLFDRNDRDIFGYKAFIVLSDSMSATDFDAGDLVVVRKVDPTTLKEGDNIAYQSQNEESFGEVITHKIRRLTQDVDGNPGFITYGTTTNTDDATVVTYPFIIGRHTATIPKVGIFFRFMKTTQGYIICILIPFILLILYQGLNCIRIFQIYKAEQMTKLQEERKAFEEQKRQSEIMMAELQALREQLAAGEVQDSGTVGDNEQRS